MILTGDYHTHTPYSHGKNTIEENVKKAKEIGLKQIAITDHGFSHVAFGLRRWKVEEYIRECKEIAKKYGIDVLVGIESNIRGVEGKADLKERPSERNSVSLRVDKISRIPLPAEIAHDPLSTSAIFLPWRACAARSWSRFSILTNAPPL